MTYWVEDYTELDVEGVASYVAASNHSVVFWHDGILWQTFDVKNWAVRQDGEWHYMERVAWVLYARMPKFAAEVRSSENVPVRVINMDKSTEGPMIVALVKGNPVWKGQV